MNESGSAMFISFGVLGVLSFFCLILSGPHAILGGKVQGGEANMYRHVLLYIHLFIKIEYYKPMDGY